MKKNWTGERLETFINGRDAIEHLHRYAILSNCIINKVVLDIACGEGYGSNLLAQNASYVHGVDIDEQTIILANKKYKKKNLNYTVGDTSKIPFDNNFFDVVVSYETIEHHDQHHEMIKEIKRVLKPNGKIIISTPDKLFYSDKTNFSNKFHIKELYKQEFLNLMSSYFSKTQLLTQQYSNGVSIIQDETEISNLTFFTGNFIEIHKKAIDPLYLIIIASDIDFSKTKISIFDGVKILEEQLQKTIYSTKSYKIGNMILLPIRWIRKKIK